MRRLIGEPGQRIELELSGVEFIDSSGLEALLVANRLVADRGGELTLVAPSPRVLRVLELTGCLDAFTVVPSEPELGD